MPFFPDSFWGLAYLTALVIFGAITWAGPNLTARRILFVLVVHWVAMRSINVIDHDNFILWLVHDYVFFIALLVCGGGIAARACSGLFLVMVAFDSYSLVFGGSFEGAAAVAEVIGYLAMIIMAGSAHGGTNGKLAGHSHSLRTGIGSILHLAKIRLPLARRAGSTSRFNP
jgi:hypothetical protein